MVVSVRKEFRMGTNFSDFLAEQLKNDPELALEYHKAGPRFDAVMQLIKARNKLGLTQTELAKRMGVLPHVVSRLESMEHSPRLDTLAHAAIVMGYDLQIKFAKKHGTRKQPHRDSQPALRKKTA